MLALNDFDYHLPRNLIAQTPSMPRDHSRLLLIDRQSGQISHHRFFDLSKLIPPKYFFVANNTKVFPARLHAKKDTGGQVELLLLNNRGDSLYEVLSKPGLKPNAKISLSPTLSATVVQDLGYSRLLRFSLSDPLLTQELAKLGTMPTPPYIKKMLTDPKDYQTIYAKLGFSAAAPTAGLHFTPKLLGAIKAKHPWLELTLDVGLGTFLPVKSTDLTKHHMHTESYSLSPSTANNITKLKSQKHKLLAVGTTTTRALESNPMLTPGKQTTKLFLYPPAKFQLVDALLTNFHLPRSTLLMMVSAFVSTPNTKEKFTNFQDSLLGRAYLEAIEHKYRFFSFGDAMLIL